jgi:hypothetical protein
LTKINEDLEETKLAIKGAITLTSHLETIIKSFNVNEVPIVWKKWAFASEKGLTSWI